MKYGIRYICPECGEFGLAYREQNMRLTPRERDICRYYSKPDKDGKAHCHECPLVIDKQQMVCKANKKE